MGYAIYTDQEDGKHFAEVHEVEPDGTELNDMAYVTGFCATEAEAKADAQAWIDSRPTERDSILQWLRETLAQMKKREAFNATNQPALIKQMELIIQAIENRDDQAQREAA